MSIVDFWHKSPVVLYVDGNTHL